jgi:hypothetical protein
MSGIWGCVSDVPESGAKDSVNGFEMERRLEVGVTDSGSYRELAEGEAIPIVRGVQGGHMVLVAFRAFGFDSQRRMLMRSSAALDESGESVADDAVLAVNFQKSQEGEQSLEGYRVILNQPPETLFGRSVVLSFTVSDRDDETVAASAGIRVTLEEG